MPILINTYYLLLGGNEGLRLTYLHKAMQALMSLGKVVQVSSIYETAAWGPIPQPHFYNICIALESGLMPEVLLLQCLNIEEQLGRIRNLLYGPRTIDIDMLACADLVIDSEVLSLPHPRIAERAFVLKPFAEIAPNYILPQQSFTIQELWEACTDTLTVQLIAPWPIS